MTFWYPSTFNDLVLFPRMFDDLSGFPMIFGQIVLFQGVLITFFGFPAGSIDAFLVSRMLCDLVWYPGILWRPHRISRMFYDIFLELFMTDLVSLFSKIFMTLFGLPVFLLPCLIFQNCYNFIYSFTRNIVTCMNFKNCDFVKFPSFFLALLVFPTCSLTLFDLQ